MTIYQGARDLDLMTKKCKTSRKVNAEGIWTKVQGSVADLLEIRVRLISIPQSQKGVITPILPY